VGAGEPLERFREAVNQSMLALENALGRTPLYRGGRVVSADTQLRSTDGVVLCKMAGNLTVTLPVARQNVGRTITVKKLGAANTLTVATLGGDQVEGAASLALTANNDVGAFQAVLDTDTGETHWYRVGEV